MAIHKPFLFVPTFVLAVALTACTIPGVPAAVASTPTPAPSPTATPTITACTNPFFPVVNAAEWSYRVTGVSSASFKHSIIAVRPDGFTDQDVFNSGATRTGEWKCEAGALSALSPAESLSAVLQTEGMTSEFKTTSASGVTIPAVITPGTAWSQTFAIEGTQTVSGQEVAGKGDFTYSCTAGDIETVVVTAGAFEAVRVGCQINGTILVNVLGFDVPTELTSVATIWYARGVGMVKTENELSGVGHSTIELTSYTIP